MPDPTDPHATASAPADAHGSVASDRDETATGSSAAGGSAGPRFGPPAAAGEVGTLGPYRVVKELGCGGMGAVYAAVDTRLDRRVAFKVMLPQFAADVAAKERFLREARSAARVKHANVVTVYEADERDGVPYIAMEFLEGLPLDAYLKRKGSPPLPQIVRIAIETASGLAAAHTLGLVHRDVKPANLWLEAPNGRVKVLDFGLARPVDGEAELTQSGAVVGTPAYMSPEQARGERVDARTDLFSLGSVLYRLCAGKLPFRGPSTMAVLMALGMDEPNPVRALNPSMPESLADLIHQLLAKSPGQRPQSAAEVVQRLRAVAQELAAPRPAAELSASLPQVVPPAVVYTATPVTAFPEASPFADLGAADPEATQAEPTAAPASPKTAPVARRLWPVAGVASLAAVIAVAGSVALKSRSGGEQTVAPADGGAVAASDKGGKGSAGPKRKPTGTDADRKAAEYALSIGGKVRVNGEDRDIAAAPDLPAGPLTVTSVDLQYNEKVTDAGLAHFAGCKGLAVLRLGGLTRVTDAGLAHFKECEGLTHLDLWRTQATDAGLAHFARCRGLTLLGLDETGVTDAGVAHFAGCKGLEDLGLGSNGVTDRGLAYFRDCKGLKRLHAYGTRVTDAGLAHFAGCKDLEEVWVYDTGVTDAGLAHFKGCKRLRVLHLDKTAVTDAGLELVKDFESVGILRLRGTGVTDAGLAHLAGRKWLTHLDLGGTRVTDRGLAHLKGHKALVLLGLNATATTDAGLANFANCEGLSELDLGGTRTTDAGLALFADCKGLKLLNVQRTQVTAKGLAGFHAAVPGCRIAHDGGGIEPKAADPDRAAAEWVLSVGGRATVQTAAGAQSNVAVAKDLPAGPLTVVAVDLKGRGAAVTDAGLVRLRELAGVTHVKLGGTGVTDAGLAHLAGKAGLKLLDLERTGVTDAGLAHLRSMTALRSLSLGRTGVTDAGLECLAGLKALGALNLGHTGTTGAGLAHLKPLTALYELSLYGTALADRDAGRLAELTSLVRLSVTDTPLTRDAVRQVAAALPGCRVEWGGGVIEPADADRAAAGLVIAVLGTVRVDGAATDIATAADLPRGRFALTAANLSGREAWEEVVAALGRCGRLATIDLDGTTIADARLAHLHGLEALARLSVRRTKVTAKGLEALHAAVPGCRVEHDGGVIEPKK